MGIEATVLRWGVIGTGRICETFVPDIQAAGGRVVGVWGRTAEKTDTFAQEHDIPFATLDLEQLLGRDDIDVVYVATPPATHLDLSVRALQAGKHVLVEKPMATSAADVEQLFDVARSHDRFVMEAMWMKFNPLHVEVVRRIQAGLIGEPRYVRGAFGMPFPAGGSRWDAALGGSTVLDQGIYPVTLAIWVLGQATELLATGTVRDGVDVTAQISMVHENGRTSQLACSVLEFVDPSASMSGTAGWVEIPAMFWATDVAHLHAGSTGALFGKPELLTRPREGNGYIPMIRSVTKAISSGHRQHPEHDLSATRSVARVLDAVRAQIHGEVRA
ncbi:Gfo/Idh/MocA family protein [Microbacterium hatanonis]|uniref:Gfo/Idh/MocA family protein n=1 Tax=Microbacterium hatanonis TaxID=404366 RepID=UPI00164FC91A|nr:Gfo/Idh/MocA family oxidoreductase [Microbacterium hatanonis]